MTIVCLLAPTIKKITQALDINLDFRSQFTRALPENQDYWIRSTTFIMIFFLITLIPPSFCFVKLFTENLIHFPNLPY